MKCFKIIIQNILALSLKKLDIVFYRQRNTFIFELVFSYSGLILSFICVQLNMFCSPLYSSLDFILYLSNIL